MKNTLTISENLKLLIFENFHLNFCFMKLSKLNSATRQSLTHLQNRLDKTQCMRVWPMKLDSKFKFENFKYLATLTKAYRIVFSLRRGFDNIKPFTCEFLRAIHLYSKEQVQIDLKIFDHTCTILEQKVLDFRDLQFDEQILPNKLIMSGFYSLKDFDIKLNANFRSIQFCHGNSRECLSFFQTQFRSQIDERINEKSKQLELYEKPITKELKFKNQNQTNFNPVQEIILVERIKIVNSWFHIYQYDKYDWQQNNIVSLIWKRGTKKGIRYWDCLLEELDERLIQNLAKLEYLEFETNKTSKIQHILSFLNPKANPKIVAISHEEDVSYEEAIRILESVSNLKVSIYLKRVVIKDIRQINLIEILSDKEFIYQRSFGDKQKSIRIQSTATREGQKKRNRQTFKIKILEQNSKAKLYLKQFIVGFQ